MNTIISENDDIKEEELKIKSALRLCGYPNWSFQKVKDQIDNKKPKMTVKKKDLDLKSRGSVVIPYVKGLSERTRRIFRKHGIATAMKPNTTLRKMLVHPKDTMYQLQIHVCRRNRPPFQHPSQRTQKETDKITGAKRNFTRLNRKLSQSEYS